MVHVFDWGEWVGKNEERAETHYTQNFFELQGQLRIKKKKNGSTTGQQWVGNGLECKKKTRTTGPDKKKNRSAMGQLKGQLKGQLQGQQKTTGQQRVNNGSATGQQRVRNGSGK
jgi:hypothetical protein